MTCRQRSPTSETTSCTSSGASQVPLVFPYSDAATWVSEDVAEPTALSLLFRGQARLSALPLDARYWLRHGVAIWVELPLYALRKRRYGAAGRCLLAEAAYCAATAALWRVNNVATTWVFLLPFLISSFALMFGNW